MTFLMVLIALMVVATIVDGWSQHKMLAVNGGKGYEISKIYGQNPTYLRYALVNVPVLAGAIAWMAVGEFHYHFGWFWTGGAAFIAWHAYGTYLNSKEF